METNGIAVRDEALIVREKARHGFSISCLLAKKAPSQVGSCMVKLCLTKAVPRFPKGGQGDTDFGRMESGL